MPALSGQIISTITDGTGQPAIVATWFYNPADGVLRNGTFTTSTGAKTGALIVDNLTGQTQAVSVRDSAGALIRTFSIPSSGRALTAAQLAAVPAPNGPVTTAQQLNGLTFDLA